MTDSSMKTIPLPPTGAVPPGTVLYYEIYFHEGITTNTQTTQVLSGHFSYDSTTPFLAYQQAVAAKTIAYKRTTDYVAEYEKNNPNGYCAVVKAVWYTDASDKSIVTPFMKGIQAPGVHPTF